MEAFIFLLILAVDENRIFDGRLSYDKGAAIIHNLRFEVGNDSIFFQIFKTVQIRFKDSTITGLDFKAVAEELSGKNFTDFFNQWYFGEGFPTLDVVYSQQNDTLVMNVNQSTSAAITPLFKMNMEYKVKFLTGDTIIKLFHQANTETFKIPMHKLVKGLEIDPNNWVVNGNGSVKLIADTQAVSFVVFPNPCSDYLQFYLRNNGNYEFSVFDVTGKNIMSDIIFNTEMIKLNIQNLEKGIYFLQISDSVNRTVQKFVKK